MGTVKRRGWIEGERRKEGVESQGREEDYP